jgi:hypothetical protein
MDAHDHINAIEQITCALDEWVGSIGDEDLGAGNEPGITALCDVLIAHASALKKICKRSSES